MSNSMKCKDARGMSCFAMAPGGYCGALQDTRFKKGGCAFYKSISTEIDSENEALKILEAHGRKDLIETHRLKKREAGDHLGWTV